MRIAHTSVDLLESMAFNSGHLVERHEDSLFLTIGETTWTAQLQPAGGAR